MIKIEHTTLLKYSVLLAFTIGTGAVVGQVIKRSGNEIASQKDISALVKDIEYKLVLPADAYKLASYDRYYAKERIGKDQFVVGIFRHVSKGEGKIKIVEHSALPVIFDGGCGVVRIRYSIDKRKIVLVECNGEA